MYEDRIEINPEDWEKGWEMDADEAESLSQQYDEFLRYGR